LHHNVDKALLGNIDDHLGERSALTSLARDLAAQHGFPNCEISVNAADRPAAGQTYLTVTGTSSHGDRDLGRGRRRRPSGSRQSRQWIDYTVPSHEPRSSRWQTTAMRSSWASRSSP
jgi:hypothetical protein